MRDSRRLFRHGAVVRLDYRDQDGIGRTAQTEVGHWDAARLYLFAPPDPQGAPVPIPADSELILWVHSRPHTYAAACRAVAVHDHRAAPPAARQPARIPSRDDRLRGGHHVATVNDLSGGGCSLFRPAPPPGRPPLALPVAGTTLRVSFAVPDSTDVLSLGGRVVRSWEVPGGQRLAIEFSEVDRRVQDPVVRYVFHRQRQLLRRVRGAHGARP